MTKRMIPVMIIVVLLFGLVPVSPVAAANSSATTTTVTGTDYYCYQYPYPDATHPYGPDTPPVTTPWKRWAIDNCKFTSDPHLTGVNSISISAQFKITGNSGTGTGIGTFKIKTGTFNYIAPDYTQLNPWPSCVNTGIICYMVVKAYLPVYPFAYVEVYSFTPSGGGWEGGFVSKLVVLSVLPKTVVATSVSAAAGIGTGSNKGQWVEATAQSSNPDPLQYPVIYRVKPGW